MCSMNSEPIRFWCWSCARYITSEDKPVHDSLKHDTEPEGEQ